MKTITTKELKQKIDSGEQLTILDVREPHEYMDWHIEGSINLPVSNLMHRGFRIELPKENEIVTVCVHGFRSETARRILAEHGYNVRSLDGGMVEWNSVYDFSEIQGGVVQIRRVGKGCLSYLLVSGREAVVIDPIIDTDIYQEAAKGAKIVAVIDTHLHTDHVSGKKLDGAKYFAPEEVGGQHEIVKDGGIIKFGTTRLMAIAAPGHTPGSMVYSFNNILFTGDTIFVDGVGQPDIDQPVRDSAAMFFDTLQKLFRLPDDMLVLPGHYDIRAKQLVTTLGEIKQLFTLSKDEFVMWAAKHRLPEPDNFETIKSFNNGTVVISRKEIRELDAGANRCVVK
ncbi:MAG: rhodanese-like domain-containing protein [Candidatus Aenigmatarchaeota archaeon]